MKAIFVLLFGMVPLAMLHAITLNWAMTNSQWNVSNWAEAGFNNVYVVESTTELTTYEEVRSKVGTGTTTISGNNLVYLNGSDITGGLGAFTSVNDPNSDTYYYFVIFDEDNTTDGDYMVSNALKYTAGSGGNGITSGTVGGPGTVPDANDFFDPGWMGGTWSAPRQTPEPTALALLALGIAGFALRRKAV